MTTDIQKFEKGFAQELDGWMWNFSHALQFVGNKAAAGEIDFTLDPKSIEYKQQVIALASEFYDEDDDHDLEAIEININSIAILASGDETEIVDQLLVYFEDGEEEYEGLTVQRIIEAFRGKPIEAAKALVNAQNILYKKDLTYPHD